MCTEKMMPNNRAMDLIRDYSVDDYTGGILTSGSWTCRMDQNSTSRLKLELTVTLQNTDRLNLNLWSEDHC